MSARKPDRFVALGTVPLQDGNEAAKELERSMQELGFKGCQILTNVAGKELSDPAFAPFWAKAEALGALVVIHPNGFTGGERFSRLYFSNVIGNPLDTTVALHYLIFDGVLERHPNLKILAVHGGGYLGGYSGRIDHAWGARTDVANKLPKPPTEYLKKVYFDTVVFTPHQLEYLVKVFGADHILMGTDYPFDMADYDPVGHVVETETLDAKTVAAISRRECEEAAGTVGWSEHDLPEGWTPVFGDHAPREATATQTPAAPGRRRAYAAREHFAELVDHRRGRRVDGAAVHVQAHHAPLAFRDGVELDRVLARDIGERGCGAPRRPPAG